MIRGVSSTTRLATRWVRHRLTPEDQRQIGRLVGFLEYGNALTNLDELVPTLTTQELEQIDEMIKARAEFAVFTNLSRRVEPQVSFLSERPVKPGDRFERRGLAWVMALARIELGSMLAGFTDARAPFSAVRPTRLDIVAYKELLLDGVRSHYWGLKSDPELQRVTRLSPANPRVLSYSRRLVLARSMARAASQAYAREFPTRAREQMQQWQQWMGELQAGFILKIRSYLESQLSQRRSVTKSRTRYEYACRNILRTAQREAKAGTAKVIELTPKQGR